MKQSEQLRLGGRRRSAEETVMSAKSGMWSEEISR